MGEKRDRFHGRETDSFRASVEKETDFTEERARRCRDWERIQGKKERTHKRLGEDTRLDRRA